MSAVDQQRVAMARAYGEKHGCGKLADELIRFVEAMGKMPASSNLRGHEAVIAAILRGEVEPVADGPRACYPAKNFAALTRFMERGDPRMLESGDDAVMDWVVFAPEKPGDTFGFEFRKDCDCGSLDHLHVEPEDVPRLVRFLGGHTDESIRSALDGLSVKRGSSRDLDVGYERALEDVAAELEIAWPVERGEGEGG